MPRAGEARLDRLAARSPPDPVEEARKHRGKWRWYVAMADIIREAAEPAGIDPATIGSLRYTEEAAIAHLQAIGDTPEAAAADAALIAQEQADWPRQHPGKPDPRDQLLAELYRDGERYRDGSNPDLSDSFHSWLAWALAQAEPAE